MHIWGNKTLVLNAGYDKDFNYHWLRVSVMHGGREWHDLVRKYGDQPLNYKVIAEFENAALERENIPIRITEQMVKQAFEE